MLYVFVIQKYLELEADLKRCELQVLKEMGYICHVELPHKLMVTYLEVLEAPHQMIQEAWNIANDRYVIWIPL